MDFSRATVKKSSLSYAERLKAEHDYNNPTIKKGMLKLDKYFKEPLKNRGDEVEKIRNCKK